MEENGLISVDDLIETIKKYKHIADKTESEEKYIEPVSIKVWQAGILLGMSDDLVRYLMIKHEENPDQGLDIGYIKTGKTGRHSYMIRDDKLAKELGISRLELRNVLNKYCTNKQKAGPRSMPIYKMASICGTTPQELLQVKDLGSLIRIIDIDEKAIYYAISNKMIYHFINKIKQYPLF